MTNYDVILLFVAKDVLYKELSSKTGLSFDL